MSERILVVDDEPQILRFLRATLSGHGYEVTTAPDGETALAELHGRLPALVLLDLGLPGIDGLEVCRRLRRDPERPEWRTLPIVILSAREQEERRQAPVQLGQRRLAIRGGGHLVAVPAQRGAQEAQDLRLVVHDEDALAHRGAASRSM